MTISFGCCCIICLMTCLCGKCEAFRNLNPNFEEHHDYVVNHCKYELEGLDKTEKKDFLRSLAERSATRRHPKSGNFSWRFLIGPVGFTVGVCVKAFKFCFNIKKTSMEKLLYEVKHEIKKTAKAINDRTPVDPEALKNLQSFAEFYDVDLEPEDFNTMRIPNSQGSLLCCSWMKYFFELMGDHMPNGKGEIHLEIVTKREIYEEYCVDMMGTGNSYVSARVFKMLWRNVFPHVKIRRYKQVSGKCHTCFVLSNMRRSFRDKAGRAEISHLHALHRAAYMNERRAYYDNRLRATLNPHSYVSTIADGMAQHHSQLPWLGNVSATGHIKQHLQGVRMHGDNTTIYRTFNNIKGGSNLAAHSWLLSLERRYKENGNKLPDTIYHQIDGGPENATHLAHALCELMVSKRLTKKIVLSRLMVGHTHEDIDALFALIWKSAAPNHVLTPKAYEKLIYTALRKTGRVFVEDLYAVPDYKKYFHSALDKHYERAMKEQWTQLVFIFEAVEPSVRYPLGSKVTYRAYAADKVTEIVNDDKGQSICGLRPRTCLVPTCPSDEEPALHPLQMHPSGELMPAPFVIGARKYMDALLPKLKKIFKKITIKKKSRAKRCAQTNAMEDTRREIERAREAEEEYWLPQTNVPLEKDEEKEIVDSVEEWRVWTSSLYPQSDCAIEYVAHHPMHIPFKDTLFNPNYVPHHETHKSILQGVGTWMGKLMEVVRPTSSVLHKGQTDKDLYPARVLVTDDNGIDAVRTIAVTPTLFIDNNHAPTSVKMPRKKRARKTGSTNDATLTHDKTESTLRPVKDVVCSTKNTANKRKRRYESSLDDTDEDISQMSPELISDPEFSSSDESDNDVSWNFQYAPRPSMPHTVPHWDLIGHKFIDNETGEEFEIEDVCVSTDNPGEGYFFRYGPGIYSGEDDETHHTPCEELLKSSWAAFSDAALEIISAYKTRPTSKSTIATLMLL